MRDVSEMNGKQNGDLRNGDLYANRLAVPHSDLGKNGKAAILT